MKQSDAMQNAIGSLEARVAVTDDSEAIVNALHALTWATIAVAHEQAQANRLAYIRIAQPLAPGALQPVLDDLGEYLGVRFGPDTKEETP